MAAATHFGTCQICGRYQKLPNGRLSKHGYTVQWGFFQGVCHGANGLPFEQSTDLIEEMIAMCEQQIANIGFEIGELRAYEGTKGWVNKYYEHGQLHHGSKSCHRWERREITMTEKTMDNGYVLRRFYADREFNPQTERSYSKEVKPSYSAEINGLVDAIKYLNEQYIEHSLTKRIDELRKYIAWQQSRIKDWKPAELTPVN